MNANELKDHLREWMRKPTEDLKAHLEEMGVETGIIRQKTALIKLHADHHGSAPLTGAESVGANVKPEPAKAPARKPATPKPATKATAKPATKTAPKAPARKPATRTAPKPPARTATAKPATKTTKPAPARRTAAKAAPKPPARKTPAKPATKAPAPKPEANGSAPSANASKHDLAKRLIDMVAAEFAGESDENKAKLAYWLHGLPTGYPNGGGGGYLRYWPAGLPRPTTAGWRKPEGE